MQQQAPRQRAGSTLQSGDFSFEAKIDNEEQLVDAMLASLSRGTLPSDAWDRLHAAAQRDGRLSELAFAFESASQSKRLKTVQPPLAAEFLFQTGRYFGDVFGDAAAAVTYLERALALAPSHTGAFAMLERVFEATQQPRKLADLYAATSQHRPRIDQAPLLRRAAELLVQAGGADDKVIDLLQQVLRLEPGDEKNRARLENLYVKANRLRDVVRLNEQALTAEPPPDDDTRKLLLGRVVELYGDKLHEPERAMPHIEQLLGLDPTHEVARRVAQKLVVIKGLAGRAAAALATAFESSGTPQEVVRFLSLELENTRGPKRATLLARLGRLKQERLDDDAGAIDAFEQALAVDATDDDLRTRYTRLASRLERYAEASKTLARVLATVKDPAVKAKTTAQLGEMLLRSGDTKRAKTTLAGVLATQDAPSDAVLAAAHSLREVLEGEKDARALCDVLERIAGLEPDVERRREVDDRLSELATKLKDVPRAIAAYERLLSTSSRARALEALAPLYEASGDPEKHARLLEERAKDTVDDAQARDLMMRAAHVRAVETKDATAAVETCRAIVARFSPARDVLAIFVPLLESQRLWPELAESLAHEAALTEGAERAQVLARLGVVRLQRLRDAPAAIEAFEKALRDDPRDKTARVALEKLAGSGDHRLAAARVLEPVYRAEGATAPLLRVLELRGTLSPDVQSRLAALREAADLAASSPTEANRAAEAVGRGLLESVAAGLPSGEWVERLDVVAGLATDPKRRASILAKALGDREVTSQEIAGLTRAAAEAHAASGDAGSAIALYRRALAHDPQSAELLTRIDELLRDQGSPRERIALYTAALARGDAARRKDLLHRIASIERHDLGDVTAAIATYRTAIGEDPDDQEAHAALVELLAQTQAFEDLSVLLEAKLDRLTDHPDAAREVRATLATIAASRQDSRRAREQCLLLLQDPLLGPEHLDAIEKAASDLEDADLARRLLVRRAEMAQDPRDQIAWLDRLGDLEERQRGDLDAAATAWKRAGGLAEAAGDDEAARRLLGRARKVAPDDRDLLSHLASLCERAGLWAELPPLYASLAETATDDAERVSLALRAADVQAERLGSPGAAARHAARAFELAPARADVLDVFERLSMVAGAVEAFEHAIDHAIGAVEPRRGLDAESEARLVLARARVLGSDPARADDAAAAYRAILADGRFDRSHHAAALAAFEALVARAAEAPARRADRRWLLEWKAEHASKDERVARMLEWAREEETQFSDPAHALAIHRRVLGIDPECDEALAATARLALAAGETEDAIAALKTRRERTHGPPRTAIELEIAEILVARTTRWGDAVEALRAVLADSPADPKARALAGQLLAQRATRPDAVAMLERACEAADDDAVRSEILARLLDAPADVEDVASRRRWFERLSDQQREAGQAAEALATALKAAREMPDVPDVWDRAEGLARALSHPDDVAALYEEVLGRALSPEQALAIGERAVQFYEEWFEDSGRVVRILERVLELDPTADWAFDRLKLVLDAAERWDDLFALYDRALAGATGKTRATLLEDAAQTAKDFADRPDRAILYLEQLKEIRPKDLKLASALERLYERQGQHRELVSLLTARLPGLGREETRKTRLRVAALWLEELGDPAAALSTVEPLLETGDTAEPDLWSLLERVLSAAPATSSPRRSGAPPGSDPPSRSKRAARRSEPPTSSPGSVRQRAAGWLRDHYAATGRDADLARMFLIELESVRSAKDRGRRHVQVAELYEKLGDFASALEQTGAAVVLAPDDEDRRSKLAELAQRASRLDRLGDLLAAAAEEAPSRDLRVRLTMQAAEVRADRLGDGPGASALLASILATPEVPDVDVLAAARKLEPLLEAAGRPEERLDVLERVASVEPDPTARSEAVGKAARLAAQLGQNARGIALWERRLADDDRDADALDGLVDLLDRERSLVRLAEILAVRSLVAQGDDRRRSDRVRLARLLADVLERPEEAIETWRSIERDFGDADDAALSLAALLRGTEKWQELAALLERGADRATDAATRAELLRQLGDVQREQLTAPADAVSTYARALAADPRNAGARSGLERVATEEAHGGAAVEVLLGALRACDDWQGILELLPHRLSAASTDAARLAVLLESATIAEERGGNPRAAFDALERAFAIAPGDATVQEEIERLAEAAAAWPALVASYRAAIDGTAKGDAALVAALWQRMAARLESPLADRPGALAAYLQVVAAGIGDASVRSGCDAVRVAGALAEWDVAAHVVVDLARSRSEVPATVLDAYGAAAEAAAAWNDATRALGDAVSAARIEGTAGRDVYSRLAEWHRDRRGDADAAEAAFGLALALEPDSADLLAALAILQRRAPRRALVDTLTRLSRATGGDLALLREAAEVARDAVGDGPLARSIMTEVLDLARNRWSQESAQDAVSDAGGEQARAFAAWAIEGLAQLSGEDGDSRAVLQVLEAGDALPFDAAVRRGMRRRAARIALDGLGDHDRAIALYLSLFDDDPNDGEAVDRLVSAYGSLGRTRDLLRLRERQVAAAPDATRRIALRLEAARLLVVLGDATRAAELLHENLREEPRDPGTVDLLAQVLDAEDRAGDLRELLAGQARLAEDAGDVGHAAALWQRAAVLAEERLREPDAAAAYYERVVGLLPNASSYDALARLAEAKGAHAAAAEWLERLTALASPSDRVASTLRLAESLVCAGQGPRAAERLEQALTVAPEEESLRARLSVLYRDQEDWPKLARLTTDAAAHARDKATRMARLLQAAALFSDRCGEPEAAVPLLEQAADLAPDDQGVRLGLADVLARARRFDDARAILKSMVDSFGARRPKERAPVHYQIARLELAMGNRARALLELDTAARVDPQNPEILRALAELARDDGQLDRAERSYRALLVVLRRREESREGAAVARSEVLLELGSIAERQGESDRATEILESALEAASQSEFEQDRLEAALRARRDDSTLVRVLQGKLARQGDSPAAANTLAELADVLANRLDRPEEALPVRLRALAIDPRSDAAHEQALALARSLGAVAAYIDGAGLLVDRATHAGDAPLACTLLLRLGRVAEADLHDDRRAAALYERAVDLGQRTVDVLRALDAAYERIGDVDAQARVLGMRVEAEALEGGPRAASDAIYRLATLRLASRRTLDAGAQMMQTAMDLDPQLDRAEDAIRRALEIDAGHKALIDLYESVGRQPGHERALIDALRHRARLPGDHIASVREAVEIALRIHDPGLAESLLEWFVEDGVSAAGAEGGTDGENLANLSWALGALASLRESAGDLRRAVELKQRAARIADPEVARRLEFDVARLASDKLGDLDLAAETYEALHAGDPADREAWEPLAAVYRKLGNARKLSQLLASVVDRIDDVSERARLRLERVRTMVQGLGLSDADAAPLLREIVDDDPSQLDAALMLAEILERSGATEELAQLLAKQIDAAKDRGDSRSIASLALRLGYLLADAAPAEARQTFYTGLDWEPKDSELLAALLGVLGPDPDVVEKADLTERLLALEEGPHAETMALDLWTVRREAGDEPAAERALELGFRAYPASATIRDRLEATYRQREDWQKLAELCSIDARARTDTVERIARLREAADLWRNRLGDPAAAAAALRAAREVAGDDLSLLREHVDYLVEAHENGPAIAELSAALDRLGAGEGGRRGELLAARAIVREAAGDGDGALDDLEHAFALERAPYAGELAAQLERARESASRRGDTAATRKVQLRLAQVLPFASEEDRARTILGDLLKRDAKDVAALRTLANLETELERWDAASAALRRLVGLEEGDAAIAAALKLADACERAGRPGDARGALERARSASPGDRTLRLRLERVLEETGAWHELSALFLEDARAAGDVADRCSLLLRAGAILVERAADPAAAVAPLEEARALRPTDPESVGWLAEALLMAGRAQDALALLEDTMSPHKGKRSRELASLYWRLSRVLRAFDDDAGEVRALVQALECDAQNGQVCSDVSMRAMEMGQLDLATRALRATTLLKTPGPLGKALAYHYMGEIALKQGDSKRALTLLKRALSEDPSLDAARTLVREIESLEPPT